MGELQEDIKEIKELIRKSEEERKVKKFRLPFGKKVGKGQAKRDWVTVVTINQNGHLNFTKQQIQDQTIMVDGVPRLVQNDYVLFWKKNPMIILPSWSVRPFSPAEQYQKSMNDGSNINGYKLLLAKMKMSGVDQKKKMGGWGMAIGGIVLAGIVIYAFMTGGGA